MTFEAELWPWDAKSDSWVFVTLPRDLSEDVRALQAGPRRGFGAVKVEVSIGATTWQTSVFPSQELEAYVLPLKKAVRAAQGLEVGDTATVALRVIPPR